MPSAFFYILFVTCFLDSKEIHRDAPVWGFFGHRTINRQAVFTLPPDMMVFFKKNIEYLSIHAVDPDMRRYASHYEAARHYIDLDRYGKAPFPDVPRNWSDALAKFSKYFFVTGYNDTLSLLDQPVSFDNEDVVFNPRLTGGIPTSVKLPAFRRFFRQNILPQYYEENWTINLDSLGQFLKSPIINVRSAYAVDSFSSHGTLPYNLERMVERLTEAFRDKNTQTILRHAADIGHYVADAHVPLHTTKNYNGQLTDQIGIHAFWETRIPELFADPDYDFWVGKADLIEKPGEYFWNIVLKSHSYVDSVLLVEKSITAQLGSDEKYCNEMRGDLLVVTQCEKFAKLYQERLGGMVEERMRGAIHTLGSVWYTAWVLAGQPDLSKLGMGQDDTEQLEIEKAFKAGKQKGRPHEEGQEK
jgi:hypothetical protein